MFSSVPVVLLHVGIVEHWSDKLDELHYLLGLQIDIPHQHYVELTTVPVEFKQFWTGKQRGGVEQLLVATLQS